MKNKTSGTGKSGQKQNINDIKAKQKDLKATKRKQRKGGKIKFSLTKITRLKAKTSIETIPYVKMHEHNIMELPNGKFSKTYSFVDINYTTAREEEQTKIFAEYAKMLNSLPSDVNFQVTIINKSIKTSEVYNKVLVSTSESSKLNYLGLEFNEILKDYLDKGINDIKVEKYVSVSIEAENLDFAKRKFLDVEAHLDKKFKDISKNCNFKELDNTRKSHVLAQIYRGSNINLRDFKKKDFACSEEKSFIAPDSFQFSSNYFMMGERFAKCLFLRDIPQYMTDELIAGLLSTQTEQLITLNITPVETTKARKKIDEAITNLKETQYKYNYTAAKNGVSIDITPRKVQDDLESATEMHEYVRNKKQNVFLLNMVVMFYADSLENLKIKEALLISKASEFVCNLGSLNYQQERALQSVLPIGFNNISIQRTLPTEGTAIFMPFDRLDTIQAGGFFYSLHADTKQAIVLNRKNLTNGGGGFVLGTSGSGKGMFAKQELINIMLKTNDDVIIIDPENEFARFVTAFGGQTIELSPHTKDYINPFDIPLEDEDFQCGTPASSLKLDLILSIISSMIKGELDPAVISIVDEVLRDIYKQFEITRTKEDLPTFKDFYNALSKNKSSIAEELKNTLKIYVEGNFSVFSHPTNVKMNNRLLCFNTNRLGEHLKPVGSFMMLDAIWNIVASNRNSGKNTWIYIDEVHIFFHSDESIKRVENFYRRFRKYDGIVTSTTQNTTDTLRFKEARTMIGNSDFLVIMNQKEIDRREIVSFLSISPNLASNITNAGKGEGLIYAENMIVPFSALFPKVIDGKPSKLYELMTTNSSELSEILKSEKEQQGLIVV